jgi:hypothetical protein
MDGQMTASKEQIKMWKKVSNEYGLKVMNAVGQEREWYIVRQGHIHDLLEQVGEV